MTEQRADTQIASLLARRAGSRESLCRALGVRDVAFSDWTRWRRRALPLYVATMVLGTAAFTLVFVTHHPRAETGACVSAGGAADVAAGQRSGDRDRQPSHQ